MYKKILLYFGLVLLVVIVASFFVFKTTTWGGAVFSSMMTRESMFPVLVVVSAMVDSINPCAFSILLLTIAFLFSLGSTRKKVFSVGGVYIAGVFLVYLLIGLGILRVLSFFQIPNFMGKLGATLIILLGVLDIINAYFPKFPIRLKIPQGSHKTMARLMEKASHPAAFFLGVFVGLCEFPCTGGPYLMILGLLHDTRTALSGFEYLLLYNALFVLPLVITLIVASNESLLARAQAWRSKTSTKMRFFDGAIMIGMGVLIFLLS